ncbi:MAG: PASTA domain-containing protein [Tunicatimonas sp.]
MTHLFKVNSPVGVLIHLGIILLLATVGGLWFFYSYLPSTTHHNETVTVPDLEGIHLDNIDEFLTQRNLNYEVLTDSGFTDEYDPKTVLVQYPLAGAKVKENRKLFLTLNATNPPKVKMPALVDGSVKNAQLVLESYGLELGAIEYVPDLAQNAVLEQRRNGQAIAPGEMIAKGTRIDLLVGDGLGNTLLEVPDLVGLEMEEAEVVVVGSGLKVGGTLFRDATLSDRDPKDQAQQQQDRLVIVKQRPAAGDNIRIGEEVDLWLDRFSNEQPMESALDQEEDSSPSDTDVEEDDIF